MFHNDFIKNETALYLSATFEPTKFVIEIFKFIFNQ